MENESKSKLLSTFNEYIEAYFTQRDFSKTKSMLSPTLSGFGTGQDEKSFGDNSFLELYRRDIEQAPNPIEVNFHHVHPFIINETVGLVSSEFDLKTMVLEQPLELAHLRMSALFSLNGDRWIMEHMHLSFPTTIHETGESYPLHELEERNRILQDMVAEKTHEYQLLLERLSQTASTDALTGMYNRTRFNEEIQKMVEYIKRYKVKASLMLIDIDHFKEVNDQFGHLTGDSVLKSMSILFQESIRNVDTLARWGGDEFIILMPHTGIYDIVECAERIRKKIESHFFGFNKMITISIGTAEYREDQTPDEWLNNADIALYEAKKQGRNKVKYV